MNKLALFGGEKVITKKFNRFNTIGSKEIEITTKVLKSGTLSNYIAKYGNNFLGGKYVKEFESNWEKKFKVKHAISVNSWTSGLICSIGAINIEPGDEIILPPWTMSACAMAILHWNAIPVFADIDDKSFCIDPVSVEKKITSRTKAIMAVDIGGQSCDIEKLRQIADKNNLKLISDTAQAPLALYKGKFAGTLADIGGYSFNCHKHIQTGEGGMLVTNDDELALRLRMLRNHAESIVKDVNINNISNLIGYNFRLGEIESAIGIEQLKKLDGIVKRRQIIADELRIGLNDLEGLVLPHVCEENSHVYYMYFMKLQKEKLRGAKRDNILKALKAEGLEGVGKKFSNIHLLPVFQKKIAYGKNHFPWSLNDNTNYNKGICPNSENLEDESYIGFQMCMHEMNNEEIKLFIETFRKVWKNLEFLKDS